MTFQSNFSCFYAKSGVICSSFQVAITIFRQKWMCLLVIISRHIFLIIFYYYSSLTLNSKSISLIFATKITSFLIPQSYWAILSSSFNLCLIYLSFCCLFMLNNNFLLRSINTNYFPISLEITFILSKLNFYFFQIFSVIH